KDGSLALGASKWQTIRRVSMPTAKSGIIAGIVLGIGRAVGETMAIILVARNTAIIPASIFQPVRTMTVNIVLEMGYVVNGSTHYHALFATGIVLFVFIMIINAVVNMLNRKRVKA
ncbi:MAG: ABC transporter permease subunit, partial [Eubacteriales bacterium]|nr:ABC transporter permease subunit [Eubacteriales bacterium]